MPGNQPNWKTITQTPSEAPIESRFITAAWSGIRSERKTTSRSSAESATTIPMKNQSFAERTFEKSMNVAVAPPTKTVAPVLDSTGGSTSWRSCSTSSCVFALSGEVLG